MSSREKTHRRVPTVDQFVGALFGCGIGDALGWPFEGKGRAYILTQGDLLSFREVRRPKYGRTFPAGAYSDDTQQSLIVAESIVAQGKVDPSDIAGRLYRLWKSGEAVGVGRVFVAAMERLDSGVPRDQAASPEDLPWNGAAMRVGPVALYDWRREDRLVADVVASSHVTHKEPSAVAAAVAIAHTVVYVLTHESIDVPSLIAHVQRGVAPMDAELAELLEQLPHWITLPEEEARAKLLAMPGALWTTIMTDDGIGGGARPSVVAAIHSFLRSPTDYLKVIDTALRLGGDVDSQAAMSGLIAGAYLGAVALPPHLAAGLQDCERIREVSTELYQASLVD